VREEIKFESEWWVDTVTCLRFVSYLMHQYWIQSFGALGCCFVVLLHLELSSTSFLCGYLLLEVKEAILDIRIGC
jgi:hypothetical protein